jgi:glutathione synthase/RimK-type ligase-like ATP-grasp enzyme
MKLILANNQSASFKSFYKALQAQVKEPFDYCGYTSLLFSFDSSANQPVSCINLETGRQLSDYSGVYINGYLSTYELAATTAIVCRSAGVPFVNHELDQPPSLSKLSMYAKLAAAKVGIPKTVGGSKAALLRSEIMSKGFEAPMVMKRADADRGIDNYLVGSGREVANRLEEHQNRSLWTLQEFIPNAGFYLISFYGGQPAFCIYRTLKERPDGDQGKAHMYKPRGGSNASLIELDDVPGPLMEEAQKAAVAMDRQIASVDCLYDATLGKTHVLEVNYNPQLVTIETFKDVRSKALIDYLDKEWQNMV